MIIFVIYVTSPTFNTNEMITNPYKSKIKLRYAARNSQTRDNVASDNVPDFKLKPLKKYHRPSFSPYTNSWIVDIAFIEGSLSFGYLFFINENTRFLFCWPQIGKTINSIAIGLTEFLKRFGHKPCNIKGDGEKGFKGIADRLSGKMALQRSDDAKTRALCTNEEYKRNVRFWLKDNSNAFHLTNSYSIIDSVIRVMRNLCAGQFANRSVFYEVLRIYNNTVHAAFDNKFTPAQVQGDFLLEQAYIRAKEQQLAITELKQAVGGMTSYNVGNILLVHIPFEKTRQIFRKQRRNFSALAKFLRYEGGNAVVELLKPVQLLAKSVGNPEGNVRVIAIPIFYTKIIADSVDEIPGEFDELMH
ncbi:hypothetical protein FACS189472_10940 [Alphaproteobacteria bacterium]|nr:hypothetical protein FACS189472_10940 [Alphaproteobacteria bacterium]